MFSSSKKTSLNFPHQWLGKDQEYAQMWAFQQEYVKAVLEGSKSESFFYLEHSPIYTIGRTKDKSSLRNTESLPHPVIEINRGGQGTYHGPGQLVGYPILDLNKYSKDLHLYVRALEQALIDTCADFSIQAGRQNGLTGVWVNGKKLASIGVGVKKWISMHGFAINITAECLPAFFAITPCGIDQVEMTCINLECSQRVDVDDFFLASQQHLENSILKLKK